MHDDPVSNGISTAIVLLVVVGTSINSGTKNKEGRATVAIYEVGGVTSCIWLVYTDFLFLGGCANNYMQWDSQKDGTCLSS